MNHETAQYIHIFAELLMEISSKEDWIKRVPDELPAKFHPGEQFLWVDKYGFIRPGDQSARALEGFVICKN